MLNVLMSHQNVLAEVHRQWLATITTAGIITTLACLAVLLSVENLRKQIQQKQRPILLQVQLVLTGVILCISILHCILLAFYIPHSQGSDPVMVSSLFEVLCWIIVTIALVEKEQNASPAIFWTWICASGFQIAEVALMILLRAVTNTRIRDLDLGVVAFRTLATIVLSSTGAILLKHDIDPEASDEETQPLLSPEGDGLEAQSAKAKKNKNAEDEDRDKDENDDDDDDDDKSDEDEDAEARKELKSRSFRKYISSFAIFLPHITPNSFQQWAYVGIIVICIMINRILNIAIPLALGALINSLPEAIERQQIPSRQLTIYLALNTLSSAGIVSTTKSLATLRFDARVKHSLNVFCYSHIMTLSCDYHDQKSSQRAHRVMERGTSIANLFQTVFFDLVPQFSDLFISLGVITYLFGGYLCFTVATTIVLFTYANTKFIKKKTKLRRRFINALIAQWQHMWETLYSWATISHFSRIDYEKEQAEVKTGKMYKQQIVSRDFDAIAQAVRQIIVCTGFIAASYLATQQIVYGSRGVGDFVMLNSYWSQVMAPISGLVIIVNSVANDLVDTERILLLLERKPTVQNKDDAKDLDFEGGAVEFENVSFSYDGERMVSEDISFRVKAGQTVAIVGETGGGKSTLLKLLFRFYDPTKGRILVDGQDLKDINIETFRALVGFVPQDPAMFQRSIADNIRYPNLEATDDEVEAACKGAVLHDKIMTFTKGYKQKVGERGTRLSGGESQRLAVARVILKKPKMLLLDEATSSVDSVTETKIHECLKELCRGRTTFIIAHRLSTILHADLILVMKNGKLVEAGPHRKLIKMEDGAYRELWTAQLKLQAQNPDEGGTEDGGGDEADGTNRKSISSSPVMTKTEGQELLAASGILDIDTDTDTASSSNEIKESSQSTNSHRQSRNPSPNRSPNQQE